MDSCMQYLQNELSKGSVNPFATALRDRILEILGTFFINNFKIAKSKSNS